jgi:hypothetical protein
MSIRVGEAWTARNGHRRFVSMPLHDVLALGLLGAIFVVPLWLFWWMIIAELWLAAESAVLTVTGVLVIAALASRGARFGDVTLRRLRFGLWMIDVKGGR